MVLLKRTELKYKTKGFSDAKEIYSNKIEEQKSVYDRRIELYEKNIHKKELLINDLINVIEKMQGNANTDVKYTGILSTFEKCVSVMKRDINITTQKKANSLLEAHNISSKEESLKDKNLSMSDIGKGILVGEFTQMQIHSKMVAQTERSFDIDNKEKDNVTKYDERGFIKNTLRHKNGTKYDNEGFNKYGYDSYGNRNAFVDVKKNGHMKNEERGFMKNTARHKNGTKYDDKGFDKYGYDKNGFKLDGYHRNASKSDDNVKYLKN